MSAQPNAGASATTTSANTNGIIAKPTNTAFVLFRPDLCDTANGGLIAAHFEALCTRHKIRKERTGFITAADAQTKHLFDNYYAYQEQNATRVVPSHLRLSIEERAAFKAKFGVEWSDVTAQGRAMNAQTYIAKLAARMQAARRGGANNTSLINNSAGTATNSLEAAGVVAPVVGDITGENDDAKGRALLADACLAAANGNLFIAVNDTIVVHKVPSPSKVFIEGCEGGADGADNNNTTAPDPTDEDGLMYVVNGELPLQRHRFANKTIEGAKAMWYTVTWRSDDLSWKAFNEEVIGTAAPCNGTSTKVHDASDDEEARLSVPLRTALARYGASFFGLDQAKTMPFIDTAIVAAEGPLESFFALQTWLEVEPAKTLFGLHAVQRGISLPMLKDLCKNPPIHARGKQGAAFVVTKGLDTDACLDVLQKYAAEEAALPVLNTALVFIKPHANNMKTRALVESMLADREIRIVVQGTRTADVIRENNIITRHYSVIATNAIKQSGKDLATILPEDARNKFAATFGEELSEACAQGRVLNAKEALEGGLREGETIASDRLAMLWKLCEKVTRLAPGLYIGHSKDENKYIINGFFPLIMDKFTTDGAVVQWYLVSWAEDKGTWADFRGKVVGSTDPAKAPVGSIREAILSQWRDLGLSERPNSSDNGIHASAGPLEALAERLIWVGGGGGIEADVLTRVAAERGVSTHYSLHSWVSNPVFDGSNIALPTGKSLGSGPIFDLTEDIQTSTFVEILRQAEEAEVAARQRNHALIFIKPHAVTEEVSSVVETLLACHDITINRKGETDADEISSRNLVDRHYAVIAKYAMSTAEDMLRPRYIANGGEIPKTKITAGADGKPVEAPLTAAEQEEVIEGLAQQQRALDAAASETTAMALMGPTCPSAAGKEAFEKAFGLSWDDALRCHSILTAAEAMELLDMSPMQLSKRWKNKDLCPTTVRVSPGMYVGRFVKENIFIINGFYPLNREKFTTPGRKIRWFAVSWAEDRLTWADFRAKVIGPTDPSRAPDGSMRGVILKEWQQLGLPMCPDTSDNGVHASAGALEGLAERTIWLTGASPAVPESMAPAVEKDPFGMLLRRGGGEDNAIPLPTPFIEYCMGNPTFADTNKPIFDVTEDTQSSQCAGTLRKLYQSASDEFTKNRAVVLIRPTIATPSVIAAAEKAFADNDITVDAKQSVLSSVFYPRLQLMEPPQISALEIVLSKSAREKFHIQFGEQWDDCVDAGRIHTADAAAAKLAATYAAMSLEDQYKAQASTFNVASRWRQSGLDNNILYLPMGAAEGDDGSNTNLSRKSAAAIAPTIEVGYDPAHDWYVLNGAMCNTHFSAKDALGCYFGLSWPSGKKTFSTVMAHVVGATDATTAREGSLRGLVYRMWSQLGIVEAVAANDTGVESSTGPLQALYQRCVWATLEANADAKPSPLHPKFRLDLTAAIANDVLGQQIINNGITAELLQYILYCNPAVSIGSGSGTAEASPTSPNAKQGPIMALLAHQDTRAVVDALLSLKGLLEKLWEREVSDVRGAEQKAEGSDAASGSVSSPESPSTPSRAANRAARGAQGALALRKGRVGGAAAKNGPRNEALVFIKPHAADSDAVTQLVETKLQEHYIRIDAEGEIKCEDIAERRLIDAHYAAIASYALRADADEIGASTLNDATRAKFEATFGTSWAAASAEKRILNAAAALDTFGLSAKKLSDHFAEATVKMRLAPGLYVATLPALNNSIVINGFYPLNREKFTTPGRKIRWFAVSWAEDRLTWADFRAKVIGPTDPSRAPDGSMRGVILKEWQQLGLAAAPNVSDNGVHASAGPLEGVAERIIWTGATLKQLSFSRELITKRGVTERFLQRCVTNPSMEVDTEPIMVRHAANTGHSTELMKGAAESSVTKKSSSTTTAASNSAAIKFGPIFDILEDVQSSKALDILQRLFETDRVQNMQNTALVFIKPHAITPMAVNYVEACFRENQFDIIGQGTVTSEEIVARGLIDKHYSTIAQYGLQWDNDRQRKAKEASCDDEQQLAALEQPNPLYEAILNETNTTPTGYGKKLMEFQSSVGGGNLTLDKALRSGLLMSAEAAMAHIKNYEHHINESRNRVAVKKYDDRHLEMTPAHDLYKRWDKASTFIKLASGVYAKQICLLEDGAGDAAANAVKNQTAWADVCAKYINKTDPADDDPKATIDIPIADMHTIIVINGFYPKLKESYTTVKRGPALQWYLLSWAERRMSWADFRGKFVGPTNPLQAPTGSLRAGLYMNWRDLGLPAKPDTTDNGVHASAGPLEGLVERLIWTTPAETITSSGVVTANNIILSQPDTISPLLFKDPMACVLMEHDLSADAIARMCANPTMTTKGATKPIFVHTEDMQSSDLAPFLVEAIQEEAEIKRRAAEEAAREARRQAELLQIAASEAAYQERIQPMNTAFVFIKPHAVTQATQDLVEATFLEKGIRIKQQGTFTHNEVARVIDQHYSIVSTYATLKPVHHIVLSEDAKAAFKKLTDGKEEWEQAVTIGHVMNATEAMKELGELTPSMLARRWEDTTKKIKLAPGVYVGYLEQDDMYVVNGFYPRIRERFTTVGSSIHYYVVEWPEELLTWKQFRCDVIGPTDPTKAAETSIRGTIDRDWRLLGLEKQPNTADNGVHASAGPVEGLVERCVWLKQLPQLDPFGIEVVTKRGVPLEFFNKWTRNEMVVAAKDISGLAFDLTEDMQSGAAANLIADAREHSETATLPQRNKVALMPRRDLYEASLRDFFINLNNMSTLDDFERLFQYYDRDGNGTISREEFYVDYNRFECYGHPLDAGRVEELFTKYDFNKDGKMSFDEFCILMLERVAHM